MLASLPVVPREGDQHGAHDRADDAARAQLDAVAGQQADEESADEGADETRDDGGRPVDATTARAQQQLGRRILASRNAIVLIPRAPLKPGSRYRAVVEVNGRLIDWTFGVS